MDTPAQITVGDYLPYRGIEVPEDRLTFINEIQQLYLEARENLKNADQAWKQARENERLAKSVYDTAVAEQNRILTLLGRAEELLVFDPAREKKSAEA